MGQRRSSFLGAPGLSPFLRQAPEVRVEATRGHRPALTVLDDSTERHPLISWSTVFLDARRVPDGTRIDTDVAIVGAGAAGIAIAVELANTGISTVLLESGEFERDSQTEDLNAGKSDGLGYALLEDSRSRFLGGSTNCWGGLCRPLEPEDFDERPWVHASGWPIPYDDLALSYRRASQTLRVGPVDYDAASWERRIGNPQARLLPFRSDRVSNEILQFSPPARFGELYRSTLRRSTHIRCFLRGNLVGIQTDSSATVVEGLRVATLTGREFRIIPRIAILAMGGIENARILLLPNPHAPQGIGNPYDLVGRYFMEHPSFRSGSFTKALSAPSLKWYDSTYNFSNPTFASGGVSAAAYFSLTRATNEKEELLRNRMLLFTTFAGEENPGTDALRRLLGRPRGAGRSKSPKQDVTTFVRHAPQVGIGIVARRYRLNRLARRTHLFTIVEPEPSPDSRVTLSDERDSLGVNRPRLTWHLTSRVERTLVRAQQILAEELEQIGAGNLEFESRGDPHWCCHHIGTTRMSTDARYGVVDADCRVHGVQNLYVAGSSVFPTAGSDLPTLTIVALAIRLADHVRTRLEPGIRKPLTER
jgi:choline dehydrogenase-like flavoprotein